MPDGRPTQLDGYDAEGKVWYLSAETGGRKSFIESGFWCQFHYENADWEVGQYLQDPPIAFPGEVRTVQFSFMSPHEHWGRLSTDTVFLLREGQRVIGYGRITAILDLQKHAEERLAWLEEQTRP